MLRSILTDAHNQYVNANIQHSANSIEHICNKSKMKSIDGRYGMSEPYMHD